jgi:uncharacterized protein
MALSAPPEINRAASEVTAAAIRFGERLRAAELRADLGAVISFARALAHVDLARPEDVHAAGVACFVDSPEERPMFDAVFDAFWLRRPAGAELPEPSRGGSDAPAPNAEQNPTGPWADAPRAEDDGDSATENDLGIEEIAEEGDDRPDTPGRLEYSASELLRRKSFDAMSADELEDAARLIDQLRPRLSRRRSRRYILHPHGSLLAPRAMMRRSLATGGDPLAWIWRRRRTHPRSIVAICDVSGSMERHSRFALRFLHALTRVHVRTESFVFGTRLTRITSHLRHRDADDALGAVADSVKDWAGGTQIGQALHDFNRRWARRVLRSSAVVVIMSDGWDRGDARVVAEEMELLWRRSHRVVWLNPLAGTVGYQPRTAGMAAAYPFIDDFLPIGNVSSLEDLGLLLGRLPVARHSSLTG